MEVLRLPIARHALLRELDAYARGLEEPRPPYMERGDLLADLFAGPPAVDRTRPQSFRFQIMQWQQPRWMPADSTIASVNYFPGGGAGIGWHTDSSRPGWRVYIGRPLNGAPGMLLVEGDAFEDTPGIAHAFYVSGEPCSSWHAVRAAGARFSVGIRIESAAAAAALGLPQSSQSATEQSL